MYKLISLFFLLMICVVGVAISLVNNTPVTFNFYFDSVYLPLSLLLALTFVSGVILTLLLLIPAWLKFKYYANRHAKMRAGVPDTVLPLIKPDQQ